MLNHILEMHQQINDHLSAAVDLLAKGNAAIRLIMEENSNDDPTLFFDDKQRIVRWAEGMTKLSIKQYRFVKLLWDSETRTADIAAIEEAVWRRHRRIFVERHALMTFVARTQKNLAETGFPYKIESIKNSTGKLLAGYRLVHAADKLS